MRILLVLLLSLTLTACVSQEDADVKMAKGCVAGVNALISEDGREISEVKSREYSSKNVEGSLHRQIVVEAVEKDGWLELDKEYNCLFAQQWGLFKMFHKALLVQITVDNATYGKKDGEIIGGIEEFLKLTGAVDQAMNQ